MDTENTTHDSGTAAPSTEQNSPYTSLGSVEFALLILFMTSFMTPTWGSSSSSTADLIARAETNRKLEQTATASTRSLTLGIIGTATATAALATSILTACLL